jgi:hypothetical protein
VVRNFLIRLCLPHRHRSPLLPQVREPGEEPGKRRFLNDTPDQANSRHELEARQLWPVAPKNLSQVVAAAARRYMYELGKAVPIIPVITKADTMTIREAQNYKQEVFSRLQVGTNILFSVGFTRFDVCAAVGAVICNDAEVADRAVLQPLHNRACAF